MFLDAEVVDRMLPEFLATCPGPISRVCDSVATACVCVRYLPRGVEVRSVLSNEHHLRKWFTFRMEKHLFVGCRLP